LLERIPAVAATLLAVLLALACGGESELPDETTVPPTPAAVPVPTALFDAVRSDPENPQAHHALAVALREAGRMEEAVAHFEKVAELKPDALRLIDLGAAYLLLAKADDASAAFERALEISPGHPIALHHLGKLAGVHGETQEAITLYRQALESDPDYLIAHFDLAEALRNSGRLQEAYRGYERVVGLEPASPLELRAFDEALFQLANLDLQMGATERAVEFLRVLIGSVPNHARAHLLLGQALMNLGRREEARKEFEIHERLKAQRAASGPGAGAPRPAPPPQP
jgi:tetratricopeptide (TPR) repeat protein